MRKSYLILFLVILSGCPTITHVNHIEVYCTDCSADLTSVEECDAYLAANRYRTDIVSGADTFNVDLDNLTKTEKKVTQPGGVVTCIYYNIING